MSANDEMRPCREVYPYTLGGDVVPVCGYGDEAHGGPHVWSGEDGAGNVVQLEWTALPRA